MKTSDLVKRPTKTYCDLTVNEKINLKNNMHYSGLLSSPAYGGHFLIMNVTDNWTNRIITNNRTKLPVPRCMY